MSDSPLRSLTRALKHLLGWRLGLVVLCAVPLMSFMVSISDNVGLAILISLAFVLPTFAAALIHSVDGARFGTSISRLIGPTRRIPTNLEALHRRVDVHDLVLSSETRRPWEPTAMPLAHLSGAPSKPVLLLPGADYHLPEIVAIADELHIRGFPNVISVGIPHWDRTGDGLIWYGREIYEAPLPQQIPDLFSAVVTMKDWAGYGPLIEAAITAGLPTFAKVEGAQDFADVDTNTPRNPYRTAKHILCQGQNDFEALEGTTRTIVGSTRLERLWWAPSPEPPGPFAVINLNFTYGMLTEARELWLETAVAGCEMAGIPYVISLHPAEKARSPHPKATAVSASRLLRHATVLISRFSTLPYEAMARGVPFIYHNPHGERVPSFKEPLGAFPTTEDAGGLTAALKNVGQSRLQVRAQVERFFKLQVDLDAAMPSESRAAEQIVNAVTSGN